MGKLVKWIERNVWPWSRIKDLEVDLAASRKFNDELLSVIREIDPGYWHRKSLEAALASPRMGVIITGISRPE